MTLKIYGAGMAGLLAGHMLRRYEPEIHEIKGHLPKNHEALLRFKTDAVSIATNIPFKRVKVQKGISFHNKVYNEPNVQFSNMYAQKVTGKVMDRSINDLRPVERFISPDNFIEALSAGLNIKYNSPLTEVEIKRKGSKISTVPLPIIVDMLLSKEELESSAPKFDWQPIWLMVAEFDPTYMDVYQTLYYPDPSCDWYRASITGSKLIIEFIAEPTVPGIVKGILQDFGICSLEPIPHNLVTQSRTEFGKLIPIEDSVRKNMISSLTQEFALYSVGRYAVWKQIQLDDVVKDIGIVDRLMMSTPYEQGMAFIGNLD